MSRIQLQKEKCNGETMGTICRSKVFEGDAQSTVDNNSQSKYHLFLSKFVSSFLSHLCFRQVED